MKNLFVIALVTVFMSSASMVNAKEIDPTLKVRSNTELKKASLTFIAENSEKVFVKILDENREVVFQELIYSEEAFSRPYDLSKLNGTEFTFQVRANGKFFSEKISLKNEKANEFNAYAEKTEDNKVLLKVLQPEINPITVQVINAKGDVVFEETKRAYASFIQSFDFSKMTEQATIKVFNSSNEELITL